MLLLHVEEVRKPLLRGETKGVPLLGPAPRTSERDFIKGYKVSFQLLPFSIQTQFLHIDIYSYTD